MHLYTIGYATKPIDDFIRQLQHYNIDVVADVRSVPYSKIFKDYHMESIATYLRKGGIRYVYLGEELGPRSKDTQHYNESGQVQFDRLMTSRLFKLGIERLKTGVITKCLKVALMCAEKDPATCHRSLLLGYYLMRFPFIDARISEGKAHPPLQISHICHDGSLECQQQLELRISKIHNSDSHDDLFMTEEECCELAYKKQLEKTSYKKPLKL